MLLALTAPLSRTMLRAALLALTAPVALAVDPVDELTMAIRNGSPREALEKTQVWLRSHSANAKDTMTSMPLLSHAVAIGDARVAELLLSAGAAVDGKDLTGATPLISATSAGDAVLVRLLLSRGASGIAEQLRSPDNKMTIEEVLAKAKRRRAERKWKRVHGKEPMPSEFREDDSHVGYSGGPGEGRIVAPRLG